MKRRILFVDDEPNVLSGLRRMLRSMREEWHFEFAGSGREALEVMQRTAVEVIVTDMRMPGMDGSQLLDEVLQRHPQVVRIVLSGQSDTETVLRSVRPTHQFLSKPCDAETLKATVARACALRDLMAEPSLKDLVSRISTLPSMPSLYLEIVKELRSPDASIKRLGEIISRDVGMTAKILQLVNSAFFGLRNHVASPAQAAILLGLDTIKTLVLTVQVFSQFEDRELEGFSFGRLLDHSMTVGTVANRIARAERADRNTVADALAAGMLHDAGKLVLAANLQDQYRHAILLSRDKAVPLVAAEKDVFGATHAEVGAYLLGLWGLPHSIVEAIALHHCPSRCAVRDFSPLTAVHVANSVEHYLRANPPAAKAPELDSAYLEEAGLGDRVADWEKICREALHSEEKFDE